MQRRRFAHSEPSCSSPCWMVIVEMTPGRGSNKDAVADHVCAHATGNGRPSGASSSIAKENGDGGLKRAPTRSNSGGIALALFRKPPAVQPDVDNSLMLALVRRGDGEFEQLWKVRSPG